MSVPVLTIVTHALTGLNVYAPDESRAGAYDALYEHYSTLHDHFGRVGDDVMHALRHIRPRAVARLIPTVRFAMQSRPDAQASSPRC